jgi:hypothetical protein
MARSTLTELAQFPERITDPNWLDEIGDKEEEVRPMSPAHAGEWHKRKRPRTPSARSGANGQGTNQANGFEHTQSKPKNRRIN